MMPLRTKTQAEMQREFLETQEIWEHMIRHPTARLMVTDPDPKKRLEHAELLVNLVLANVYAIIPLLPEVDRIYELQGLTKRLYEKSSVLHTELLMETTKR